MVISSGQPTEILSVEIYVLPTVVGVIGGVIALLLVLLVILMAVFVIRRFRQTVDNTDGMCGVFCFS